MAKLRMVVAEKREVAGSPFTYDLVVQPQALTTDVGVIVGALSGDPFVVRNLTAAQAATVTTGTIYNCPIVV